MIRHLRGIRWSVWGMTVLYVLCGGTASAANTLTQNQLYHWNIHLFNIAQDNGCSTSTSGSPGLTINTTVLAAVQKVLAQAKANGQNVGYALYEQSGNLIAFNNNTSPNYGASITKSMLLVTYLDQVGSGALPADAKADLQKMIENSDNAAANRIYARITNANTAINAMASTAGMVDFKLDTSDPLYKLGQSQITADDFARFFSKIDTLIPAPQRTFATGLLSNVSPKNGLLQAGLPAPVYSKEGWKSEPTGTAGSPWIVNQAAHFVVNNVTYGVAVTVGGAKSQTDGEGTIKDLVSALMTGAATTATGSTSVTGSISSRVGKGMTPAAQQKFQQFAVAAGQKNGLDPNLIATFYYTETGNTGDSSGNHGDSAKPPPYNGDGNWAEPPAPAGNNTNFFVVGQNSLGYWAPYGLNDLDKNAYGEDGDGDGKIVLNDLADAMFTAASYIIHAAGVKGMNVGDANAYKAGVRYNGSQYALSVRNTYHYLVTGSSISVSGTITNNAAQDCTSGSGNGANASCAGVGQVTGTAKILAAARCYTGIYYEWAGGHQGYDNFKKGCPNPLSPPNNQPHGGPINGDPSGLSGNPSPCGLDCSGLVSIAVDDAYNKKYQWIVGVGTPFSTSVTGMSGSGLADSYWKSVPVAQAKPGDIVTQVNEHVEIVVSVSGNTLTTFGAHQTGEKIGEVKSGIGDWSGGAWRWTGPGS